MLITDHTHFRNPLISSQLMHERMKGRKMIHIPQIYHKIKDGDIEGDWVTIGVIIHKLPPRDTAKVRKKHMLLW